MKVGRLHRKVDSSPWQQYMLNYKVVTAEERWCSQSEEFSLNQLNYCSLCAFV